MPIIFAEPDDASKSIVEIKVEAQEDSNDSYTTTSYESQIDDANPPLPEDRYKNKLII